MSTYAPPRRETRSLRLALALTFSTGVIDAVGYLGLDRVFTGNMTGNVLVLGMGLAGADQLPVLGPVLALCGFLVGAAAAGRALRARDKGWSRTTTILLGSVTGLLVVVAVALAADGSLSHRLALAVTAALGLAMGTQAGAARHVGVTDVSTVVVTSTIVGLAADSWFGTRAGAQVSRRAGAVVLILSGAATGALLLRWQLWAPVAVAAILTGSVAALGDRAGR